MSREPSRLPGWSPGEARRRLRASRALRFEATRWRWTRTRTGRRLLVAAVAVSLAALVAGPWTLEWLAGRDAGGVLVVAASLLVSWPFWVLSQLGLWFLLDQATLGVLRQEPGDLDERQQAVRDRAYRRASRSFWPSSWSPPGPGRGR
jgi:hypothetical protein